MKVLFHTVTLNYRGTAVAVYDYAKYNQEILGNESIICYDASVPPEKDVNSEDEVIKFISKDFKILSYTNETELQKICDDVDVAYFIRYGHAEPLPKARTAVHAVFQAYNPHGDRYAYVSEWLSQKMDEKVPFVPHIVDLPQPNGDYREKLGISKEKIVVGRYGGYLTFDLPFIKEEIAKLANENDNFVFLFVNTEPFYKHKNIKYIDSIVDRQKKSNFINTCDVMLHARNRGESFGLSVCEFLFHNKPVLAWEGGIDQNHVFLLKDTNLLYNQKNFVEKLKSFKDYSYDYNSIVSQFNPKSVITKFNEVFLSE